MWRQLQSSAWLIGTAVVVFIICCVAPVFYLLFTSLGSAETAYAAVLLDARQRGLLYNTALLGAGHRRRRQRDWHTVGYCAGSRAIASKRPFAWRLRLPLVATVHRRVGVGVHGQQPGPGARHGP